MSDENLIIQPGGRGATPVLIPLPGNGERYDPATKISLGTERYLIAFPRFRRTVGLIWHVVGYPNKDTEYKARLTLVHENTETIMQELWRSE